MLMYNNLISYVGGIGKIIKLMRGTEYAPCTLILESKFKTFLRYMGRTGPASANRDSVSKYKANNSSKKFNIVNRRLLEI